jgi:MFS family permease
VSLAPGGALRSRYWILALVTGSQAGASIVQQGLGSLGPALSATFNLNGAQLGLIFGMLIGGSAATTALAGAAVDAYGERRMILFTGVVMGFALLAAAAVPSYPWLLGCMLLAGIGYAASTPAGGRAILIWFTGDRGFAMGIRQMGVPVGGVIGSLLLPFLATRGGYQLALAVGGVVTLLTAIAATLWYREPPGGERVARSLRRIFRSMWEVARDPRLIYVTLTCMVLIVAQSSMLTFLALSLVADVKLSVGLAALALALAQIGASAGRLLWGAVSDKVFRGDRTTPLMIACGLVTLSAAATALLPPGGTILALGVSFVLGFAAAGWNGLHSAAQVEIGGAERAGSALGVALTGLFAAGTVAAPLFGAFADAHGFRAAWLALAGFALLGFIPASLAGRAIARANFA